MSVLLPLLIGIILFVATQGLAGLLFNPALELRRVIGRVAAALIDHAQVYSNPGVGNTDLTKGSSGEVRRLAAELRAASMVVPRPWYPFLSSLQILPALRDVESASAELIGLSNSMAQGDARVNANRVKTIRQCLGIGNPLKLNRNGCSVGIRDDPNPR